MGRVLVTIIDVEPDDHRRVEEELDLVAALAEVAGEHDVFRASAARESEAVSLREHLAAMPAADRAGAVAQFAKRHGSAGRNDVRRLRRQVHRLEAQEAADALLTELAQLPLLERLARINEYALR